MSKIIIHNNAMDCRYCGDKAYKNGHNSKGEQLYWCDECKYGFTETSKPREPKRK